MAIKELENDNLKKTVYLGQWKQYKVWQLVYTKANILNQGRSRFILSEGEKFIYANKKDISTLTDKFISILSRIALNYSEDYTNITYTGKWNDCYVWELWNLDSKDNYSSLPQFIVFNGRRYKIIENSSETLDILNNFL